MSYKCLVRTLSLFLLLQEVTCIHVQWLRITPSVFQVFDLSDFGKKLRTVVSNASEQWKQERAGVNSSAAVIEQVRLCLENFPEASRWVHVMFNSRVADVYSKFRLKLCNTK